MKNKTTNRFAAVVPSLIAMMYMTALGVRTTFRYRNTPGDWHFIAALSSSIVFILMFSVVVYTIFKNRHQQNAAAKV